MSRFHSYVNTSVRILGQYKGEEPFSMFLKTFFRSEKKYGSSDRRQISNLCYCYFRLGKSLPDVSTEERLLIGLFLCSTASNELLAELKPGWNEQCASPVNDKLLLVDRSLSIENVFPWKDQLNSGIDHAAFCGSFFTQPDLFLRLRPGYEELVRKKLRDSRISFFELSESTLSLANNTKIESVITLDKEAVVQDYSSQGTVEILKLAVGELKPGARVWDCCAGSGGKSLLLHDIDPGIELTVSDLRKSIIENLKKRVAAAGIKNVRSFIADCTKPVPALNPESFDLILCDAPCTGSGTWSRTPEQLYFFDEQKIEGFALLQKKIVSGISQYLRKGGYLVYITCSVFKKENEEVVGYIQGELKLELVKKELISGYDRRADTMFAALLKKPL